MPKVIVLGNNGQVAASVRDLTSDKDFHFIGSDQIDFQNLDSLDEQFRLLKADWIVNCMGYTAVDKAEFEPEKARALNAFAPEKLAQHCRRENIPLIHLSCSLVFDGEQGRAYLETDKIQPINVYGQSKMEGDDHIVAVQPNAYILRTSWLYSEYGFNFLKTMSQKLRGDRTIRAVWDQVGSPTYARTLAEEIVFLTEQGSVPNGVSTFNYANLGVASWYDVAQEIRSFNENDVIIEPIVSSDYKYSAKRPANNVLNPAKYMAYFNRQVPSWRDAMSDCLRRLNL